MLLFIIGLLIDRFKGNSRDIGSGNKFNRLSERLNLSVITRAKALKEPEDKLCFKEGSR
jgi:hypothetical protein